MATPPGSDEQRSERQKRAVAGDLAVLVMIVGAVGCFVWVALKLIEWVKDA